MPGLQGMKPPPKQSHYQEAFRRALETLRNSEPQALASLGASETSPGHFEIPVLNETFAVDLEAGSVLRANVSLDDPEAAKVKEEWRILTLHYLLAEVSAASAEAEEADASTPSVSFAEMPDARGYSPVYQGRVIGRLCATAGREKEAFLKAGNALGAVPFDSGDVGFRFQVFPRLAVAIAWYDGDDEFPPGASFLYPKNILSFFPVEDMIVLSEMIVSRLTALSWS